MPSQASAPVPLKIHIIQSVLFTFQLLFFVLGLYDNPSYFVNELLQKTKQASMNVGGRLFHMEIYHITWYNRYLYILLVSYLFQVPSIALQIGFHFLKINIRYKEKALKIASVLFSLSAIVAMVFSFLLAQKVHGEDLKKEIDLLIRDGSNYNNILELEHKLDCCRFEGEHGENECSLKHQALSCLDVLNNMIIGRFNVTILCILNIIVVLLTFYWNWPSYYDIIFRRKYEAIRHETTETGEISTETGLSVSESHSLISNTDNSDRLFRQTEFSISSGRSSLLENNHEQPSQRTFHSDSQSTLTQRRQKQEAENNQQNELEKKFLSAGAEQKKEPRKFYSVGHSELEKKFNSTTD